MKSALKSYCFFETMLGTMAVVGSTACDPPGIVRIFLPAENMPRSLAGSFPDAVAEQKKKMESVCRKIRLYLEGKDAGFSPDDVDLGGCGRFQQKVLLESTKIPRGKVISYSELADRLPAPRAARAVGTALARNPFPIIFPCHRVVRSDGSLGGFGGGLKMKRALLEMEGVGFDGKGRVRPEYFILPPSIS
ncbi:MAG: methylated-DNA--[protein]-cysteine S-methyltransferase [Syntrophales bacterium]